MNQVFGGVDALSPLGPASIVDLAVSLGETSLGESGVNDTSSDTSTAGADDGLGRINALGSEDVE